MYAYMYNKIYIRLLEWMCKLCKKLFWCNCDANFILYDNIILSNVSYKILIDLFSILYIYIVNWNHSYMYIYIHIDACLQDWLYIIIIFIIPIVIHRDRRWVSLIEYIYYVFYCISVLLPIYIVLTYVYIHRREYKFRVSHRII